MVLNCKTSCYVYHIDLVRLIIILIFFFFQVHEQGLKARRINQCNNFFLFSVFAKSNSIVCFDSYPRNVNESVQNLFLLIPSFNFRALGYFLAVSKLSLSHGFMFNYYYLEWTYSIQKYVGTFVSRLKIIPRTNFLSFLIKFKTQENIFFRKKIVTKSLLLPFNFILPTNV